MEKSFEEKKKLDEKGCVKKSLLNLVLKVIKFVRERKVEPKLIWLEKFE